ncbi:PREDICTED: DNA repair protein XRCC1-like isoform X2 [Priapulus caudatus]|uniref:DNA repair protein XRCC1-like isoform X2 n=1 Tax=Priapulus caudatus TaxID=37621 RepID=A0ABM1EFX8_PRICU|nr:PREDICTED: DNA repair protein XRCC1-like isoform X2 [Priapulus caudatus]
MPQIKLQHVITCSSQDKNQCADNLLKGDSYKKWKGAGPGEKQIAAVFQFEKSSKVYSIDIGNEGSAFVEVLVGCSSNTEDDYKVILVASSLMSPVESRNGIKMNRVRIFGPSDLCKSVSNQKWDRAKIICTQPFNKHVQYGLSFVRFHSPPSDVPEEHTPKSTKPSETIGGFHLRVEKESVPTLTAGSLFASRNTAKVQSVVGAPAVRAAARDSLNHPALQQTPPTKDNSAGKASDLPRKDNIKREHKNSNHAKEQKPAASTSAIPQTRKCREEEKVDFYSIMRGVVFALSGYQNPVRGQIREMAVEMGAKYRPDWMPECTHLICAFANTPKFNQVLRKGGKIVKKAWIEDCYTKKNRMPWKRYQLKDRNSSSSDSETEDEEWKPSNAKEDLEPDLKRHSQAIKKDTRTEITQTQTVSDCEGETHETADDLQTKEDLSDSASVDTEDEINRVKEEQEDLLKKSSDPFEQLTDEEPMDQSSIAGTAAALEDLPLPELPSFFSGKRFFLYGDLGGYEEKRQIVRHITAYNGTIEDYMCDGISYVITSSAWDDNFYEALADNPSLQFVQPQWIYVCSEEKNLAPHQPYVIVPAG